MFQPSMPRQRGASLLQVVVALIVLFGFVALTVDYGSMVVRQRQLQTATDAGALAAGPDLPLRGDGVAETTAADYADRNSVDISNPNYFSADFDSDPDILRLTVKAADDVSTGFLNVLSGESSKHVSAISVVQAFPGVNPAWIAPIAVKKSFIDDNMKHRWGVPADLLMIAIGDDPVKDKKTILYWQIHYSDVPGDPNLSEFQGNVIAIDAHNHVASGNYDAAVNDYHDSILNGLSRDSASGDYLVTQDKGNGIWISSLKFRGANEGDAKTTWFNTTSDAVAEVVAASHITDTQAETINLHNIPASDARVVALILIDRPGGSGDKEFDCQFLGYVGFFIKSMSYDAYGDAILHGFFCPISGEWNPESGSMPLEPTNGLFNYRLVQ